MRRATLLLIVALVAALPALAADPGAEVLDARSALEALKALEGDCDPIQIISRFKR